MTSPLSVQEGYAAILNRLARDQGDTYTRVPLIRHFNFFTERILDYGVQEESINLALKYLTVKKGYRIKVRYGYRSVIFPDSEEASKFKPRDFSFYWLLDPNPSFLVRFIWDRPRLWWMFKRI